MSLPPPLVTLPALASRRRRAIMACSSCRKRKIKCETDQNNPQNPCERCSRKGLRCEYITVAEDPDASAAASSSRTKLATPVTTAPHVPPASYQHQGQNVYQTNPSYLQPPHVPPPASLGQFYNTQQPVLNTTSAQLNDYNAPAPMSQYPPQYAWSPSLQPQSAPLTQWGQNVPPSISAQPSHPGMDLCPFCLSPRVHCACGTTRGT